jgi:hypothetical protein
MPRITSCDGDLDDLGGLITRAYGIDRNWMEHGACRGWANDDDLTPSPWQFDPTQEVPVKRADGTVAVLMGREMQKLALIHCAGCPVQYDCAEYAVEAGLMLAGTWAMKIVDLAWLQKQDDWREILMDAFVAGTPVQVHVRSVRGVA